MCGVIAAFASAGDRIAEASVRAGLTRLANRGPDGEGVWSEGSAVLGHRRLSIIDLDMRAAQPMHSRSGRYVIAYNGEIYNFHELRRELEQGGMVFRTQSDTEVILELYATRGEAMLPRLHGMFAFVIWDRQEKRAFAARDPYGIKPLYYSQAPHAVVMASQVKAILATGIVSRDPDYRGQAGFWLLGSVPEPHTWYREIRALPAGHCAWITQGKIGSVRRWADIGNAWRQADSCAMPNRHVQATVREVLKESVVRHMVSDVPVGVFLSGGIDSGALVGLMVDVGVRQLAGVTISYREFEGSGRDEAPPAARVARHYGVRHHIRRVTRDEFGNDLPRILSAMDQPSIDGVNAWYASKAAAEQGLKVVLSGVGGDELFQGYESFRRLPRLLTARRTMRFFPGAEKLTEYAAKWQAQRTGNRRWSHAVEWTTSIAGAWWLSRSLFSPEDLPSLMGREEAEEAMKGFAPEHWVATLSGTLPSNGRLALAQIESTTYLRNQLLRDSDWASMDHGVELRTPLVDAHLLEELQPLFTAFSRWPEKKLLAQSPEKPLPVELVRREKTGFGIPLGQWLGLGDSASPSITSRHWARQLVDAYVR